MVSYLPAELSTRENEINNAITLAENGVESFMINNNFDLFLGNFYEMRCGDNTICKAFAGLCFYETSQLLLCDERN